MDNKNTKIGPKAIKTAIIAEAKKINRKKELYTKVQEIEKELTTLNEGLGMVGGYGFAVPGDKSQETKTGFANNDTLVSGISNIVSLEDEYGQKEDTINEDTIDEMKKMKEEIEALKSENASLKKLKK